MARDALTYLDEAALGHGDAGGKNLPAGVDCPASSDDLLNLACGHGTESQSDIDTPGFGDGCVAILKTDAFTNALSFGVWCRGQGGEPARQRYASRFQAYRRRNPESETDFRNSGSGDHDHPTVPARRNRFRCDDLVTVSAMRSRPDFQICNLDLPSSGSNCPYCP